MFLLLLTRKKKSNNYKRRHKSDNFVYNDIDGNKCFINKLRTKSKSLNCAWQMSKQLMSSNQILKTSSERTRLVGNSRRPHVDKVNRFIFSVISLLLPAFFFFFFSPLTKTVFFNFVLENRNTPKGSIKISFGWFVSKLNEHSLVLQNKNHSRTS